MRPQTNQEAILAAARRVAKSHAAMEHEIRTAGHWRLAVAKYHRDVDALIAACLDPQETLDFSVPSTAPETVSAPAPCQRPGA
jgi:hypothetical protein